VHHTFSPTIQLSCSFNRIANALSEIHGNRIFQSLTMHMNTHTAAGERLRELLSGREPGNSTRSSVLSRETRRDQILLLRNTLRSSGVVRNSWSSPVAGKSLPHLFSALSNMILRTAESRTQPLFPNRKELLLNRLRSSEVVRSIGSSRAIGDTLPPMFSSLLATVLRATEVRAQPQFRQTRLRHPSKLGGLPAGSNEREGNAILSLRTNRWLKTSSETTRIAHDFEHSLSVRLNEIRHSLNSAARSFTTLYLNVAAPGGAGAEVLSRRIAHFVSSPTLTYVKRESISSEKVVNALREFQSIQTESRARATPQFPSIETLTNQVRQQLERDLRIEKERRGL